MGTPTLLMLGALLFALAIVLVAWARSGWKSLCQRMGSVKWEKDSWASNLTAVGGILGTVLAASTALPQSTQALSKAQFASLSVFFIAVAALAPFVYNGTRTAKADVQQYQGFVGWYLVASLLTLGAVLAQIGTLILLIGELRAQASLPPAASYAFQAALFLTALFLVPRYGCQSIRDALKPEGAGAMPPWPLL